MFGERSLKLTCLSHSLYQRQRKRETHCTYLMMMTLLLNSKGCMHCYAVVSVVGTNQPNTIISIYPFVVCRQSTYHVMLCIACLLVYIKSYLCTCDEVCVYENIIYTVYHYVCGEFGPLLPCGDCIVLTNSDDWQQPPLWQYIKHISAVIHTTLGCGNSRRVLGCRQQQQQQTPWT